MQITEETYLAKEIETKALGKIVSIDIKIEEGRIGLFSHLTSVDGDTVFINPSCWDPQTVNSDKAKWSGEDRDKDLSIIMRRISELLDAAKVSSLSELNGKPVEITISENMIKSWRILTEVI